MLKPLIRSTILALSIVTGAHAQQQTDTTATRDADIVVRHRTDAAIARFVAMTTSTPHGAQVARWNGAICPRVLDLDDAHAGLIEDRIGAVAKSVGVAVDPRPCAPTIIIMLSADADALAKAFVERHPGLFGDPKYGIHHGAALMELEAPRPVRWIDASLTGSADGHRLFKTDGNPGVFDRSYAYNGGSRINRQVRENMHTALAIVDIKRLNGITWAQLSDYLAFVTLARPKLSASEPDSILSIFTARDAGLHGPAALTSTDMSLLKGLYSTNPALGAAAQRAQIAEQIDKRAKP